MGPRVIGIIGGLSPYSTILFYDLLNREWKKRVGSEPELMIYSLPFSKMCKLLSERKFEEAKGYLERAFNSLIRGGAKIVAMPANTPHIVIDLFDVVPSGLKFVDIREASARGLERLGVRRVGLLATKATIEYGLYQRYLGDRGFEVITPSEEEIEKLMREIIRIGAGEGGDREVIASIIRNLKRRGAEAVLIACTELSTIEISEEIPIVDSLRELVNYLADSALEL